ncbi:hypothetical protein CI109_100541 [Kwoniella shandongensis]|uniref:Uncharacterized protein n=1 Tax=Kwoniella shandongensis TaxID=1734106 RepID=A0A5M6C4Y7_9TREE|nr:uncharacterized protein CI109_003538 [Kwoniella shandongensis]KAA5528249.1 hypothetical protein CI109_003538 [Kwoniella shandongensis]
MAQPRASTDQENAPLLDNDHDHDAHPSSSSPFAKIFSPSRTLSFFEKVLGGLAVLLLLLTGVFVGLFAGAEGTLKKERQKGGKVEWKTEYHTTTATATKTSVATTTVGSVPTGKPDPKLCLTPECVTLSASIIKSLNTSIDPCDDFYEFATGGWAAANSIPADKGLWGAFSEVQENNKKTILKILDAIPASKPGKGATTDELNLAKLKAVYTSCMDVDTLNEIGRKPFIELSDHVVDIFGPFDLNPAPGSSFVDEAQEWQGAYDESYAVSDELLASAEKVSALKEAKKLGRALAHLDRSQAPKIDATDVEEYSFSSERRQKITKTLAWLDARGVDALVNFEIEGDAGGEDSQVQSLWLYQAFGGLPSKEYYEEAPILDLYQSVITGILTDIAEHTSVRREKSKRDFLDDIAALEDEAELDALIEKFDDLVESAEWPWPWPSDGDNDGKTSPGNGHHDTDDEPVGKRIEKLAAKVVKFERDIVRAGADPEYLFNPHFSYNPYATEKVSKALPFLDVPSYLSSFSPRVFPTNITVTHPPYLKSITKLVEETPDYVLSGYFITRLALTHGSALGPKVTIRQEIRRLQEVLRGIKKGTEEDRQDVCLARVDNILGFIAGKEFVKEAFSPEAKKDGEHIIRNIVQAFSDKLPHIAWMDEESAKAAKLKAESLIPKVGYPLYPNTTNPESLQSWYSRLTIKENDFFGNVLRSTLVEESRVWLGLGRQRNRDSWEMYPQTVNAYYSPPDGEIVFPAGILQPPFYSQAWPAHLRYGAFGAVAAHELTHAFDNSGSQYDEKGRLRDWWTKDTVKNFEERAQCVAKQYSKYYVLDDQGKKVYVNGNLTNGEDIGDSGLAQAFLAWKQSADLSEPQQLPGLPFSEEQLFFLAFARVWAQLTRPATAVSRVRTDPHSPPYWRAVGTLKNLDAFHKAFGCKAGSNMNPPKKEQCELW